MSDLSKNIRSYLMAQPAVVLHVGASIYANVVPQAAVSPYLYYGRTGTTPVDCLSLDQGEPPYSESFTIEAWCQGDDAAETLYPSPDGLLPALRAALSEYSGAFGDAQVKLIELEDNSDEYVARGAFSDKQEGWFVESFSVTIWERHGG